MDNEIFWVSEGSKTLNWMDKSNDQSSRALDMGSLNLHLNFEYVCKFI